MKEKLSKIQVGEPESPGAEAVAKYRPLASKLTDAEREALIARGMQRVYGSERIEKSTPRG